jgi:hypothetical protein
VKDKKEEILNKCYNKIAIRVERVEIIGGSLRNRGERK